MRVTEAMASALVSFDPWMPVGTYVCQTPGCGTVYEIIVGAYIAAFEREADLPQKNPKDGEAQLARENGDTGAGDGALSVLEDLAGSIEAPADWSAEHDHYLYGTPRRAGSAG